MRAIGFLLFSALLSMEAAAAPLPRFEEMDPSERPTAIQAVAIYAERANSDKLQRIDKLLADVPRPTKARGSIQMLRALLLSGLSRESEAQLAIQESIRLLPDYSGPLFAASNIMTFSSDPGAAADYYIRASRIDPEVAARGPTYDVFNILRRLRFSGDQRRIEALTDRLVQINWTGNDLNGRSAVVRDAIVLKLKREDVAGARALVTELNDPSAQYALLAQKVAEPIWTDIEAWGGANLHKQWPVYLREAKRRFDASNDLEGARDYLSALIGAGQDQHAVVTFLPIFMSEDRNAGDEPLLFGAAGLAGALARLGRFDEQDALYERLGRIWPLGSTTNALNLTANHANWLMVRGENARALAMIDATIASALKAGDEVNGDALAGMHQVRACVLAKSGRAADAAVAATQGVTSFLVDATSVAKMHLCLGQKDEAKKVVLRALSMDSSKTAMILALQPTNLRPAKTSFAEAERAEWEKLRADRDVVSALRRDARQLSFALKDGAPAVLPD